MIGPTGDPFDLGLFNDKMREHYGLCKWEFHSIDATHSLNQLLNASSPSGISLDFLEPLTIREDEGEELFLPKRFFVQDNRRSILKLFLDDISNGLRPERRHTVIVGSPGVGKSVLVFLAALFRSSTAPTIYYRRTASGERASVFVMFPDSANNGIVRVFFTRNLRPSELELKGGLNGLDSFLGRNIPISREQYYAFVDGPKWNETADLLGGSFDFLCTSAGYPVLSSEKRAKYRVWVVDGWYQEDAVAALVDVGKTEEQAEKAYDLCGGRIRDLLRACEDYEGEMNSIDIMLNKLKEKDVSLALSSSLPSGDPKNPDRLRTTFRAPGNRSTVQMEAVQIVDSPYFVRKLRTRFSLKKYFESFASAAEEGLRSVMGGFFEELVHKWFYIVAETKARDDIRQVRWASGKKADCPAQLDDSNLYWAPSVSNFPNIDSAIVVDKTLFAFQMTISDDHKFSPATFQTGFIDLVDETLFQAVVLYIVTPLSTPFSVSNFAKKVAGLPLTVRHFAVDMKSLESFMASMGKLQLRCPGTVDDQNVKETDAKKQKSADD
jgi:hypothetical protein